MDVISLSLSVSVCLCVSRKRARESESESENENKWKCHWIMFQPEIQVKRFSTKEKDYTSWLSHSICWNKLDLHAQHTDCVKAQAKICKIFCWKCCDANFIISVNKNCLNQMISAKWSQSLLKIHICVWMDMHLHFIRLMCSHIVYFVYTILWMNTETFIRVWMDSYCPEGVRDITMPLWFGWKRMHRFMMCLDYMQ